MGTLTDPVKSLRSHRITTVPRVPRLSESHLRRASECSGLTMMASEPQLRVSRRFANRKTLAMAMWADKLKQWEEEDRAATTFLAAKHLRKSLHGSRQPGARSGAHLA
jgi:hypothetical protein